MKIGDRVKHRASEFKFVGKIVGQFTSTGGAELAAVEQEGSGFITVFGAHSLESFSEPAPIVFQKIQLPYEKWIPVRAWPAGSQTRALLAQRVRNEHLPLKTSRDELVTDDLIAEVEFHFLNVRSGDLDNLLKPFLDLLKGSVIQDDRQITSIHARILEKMQEEGINIRLTKYEPSW